MNTSLGPSSGVMKPNPLALLKNLTVPAISHDEPFPLRVTEPAMHMGSRSAQTTQDRERLGGEWSSSNRKVSAPSRVAPAV